MLLQFSVECQWVYLYFYSVTAYCQWNLLISRADRNVSSRCVKTSLTLVFCIALKWSFMCRYAGKKVELLILSVPCLRLLSRI